MKQTNYYLYDFLDFNQQTESEEFLWKACKPTDIKARNKDVIITIPFEKQKYSHELIPDPNETRKDYKLKLRGYGEKILRISAGFGSSDMNDSPMLEISPELKINPLRVENYKYEWVVRDMNGNIRTRFNLKEPEIDYWSDLQQKPRETLDAEFYPDGIRQVRLSAYDQFNPAKHDSLALAYIEKDRKCERATISFHADHNEAFAGTGERFA
ncbi:MAG: alpha-xylosidase, partial [Bacteroidales bacterium]